MLLDILALTQRQCLLTHPSSFDFTASANEPGSVCGPSQVNSNAAQPGFFVTVLRSLT
jgi:hypothetical protein